MIMDADIAISWLNNKEMVANSKMFKLIFLTRNKGIEKEMSFELLGVILEKNLNLKVLFLNICCKANSKIKALFQIRSFLTLEQAKVLAEAYKLSNFRYRPLVWMFCGKCSNNLVMKTHCRCSRAIYKTQTKTYRDLVHINGKIDIYTQNIQILITESYKCLIKISPPFTWDYYNQKCNHYSLRGKNLLKLNKDRTKMNGLNPAFFKGAIIWNNLPHNFKEAKSLPEFKTLFLEWVQFSYTCCICS